MIEGRRGYWHRMKMGNAGEEVENGN